MKSSVPHKLFLMISILSVVILCGVVANAAPVEKDDFAEPHKRAAASTDYIIVKLQDPSAAAYEGGIRGLDRSKPQRGKFNANTPASRAYLVHLEKQHKVYEKWLEQNARAAKIVRSYKIAFNGLAIELNGAPAARAASGPGKKAWTYADRYYPTMNVSTGLIGADTLWGASRADAGKGIAVAVIDSGIDARHPFFACKGQNDIPAIQHHGPYFSGAGLAHNSSVPVIDDNHGTHVAGTVGGCVCDLSVCDPDGPVTGLISGVAPGATLHDFNVFPGFGAAVQQGGGAFSHDIAAAIEDAVALGVDVINMSLGGSVQGPFDFLAEASDAAVEAGVVVVSSAGNRGPSDATVGSPASGRKVIAAGMSSNPHFIGIPVTVGGTTYGAAHGELAEYGMLTADYTVVVPANGCTAISSDVAGKIALIDRGVCTFTTKTRNAQAAGAVGVLLVNNIAGDPFPFAHDGSAPIPTIPVAMLGLNEGNSIKPSGTASIDGTSLREFITPNADIIDRDSSRGPTPFTYLIKPDVTAPGVNVYSSVFNFGPGGFGDVNYDFDLFSGTSMASPHVAGSAALLLVEHPDWSPSDIRSALVNTGARVVTDHRTGMVDPGVLARGGGRVHLPAATATPLTFDPASASFGLKRGNRTASGRVDVTVKNVSGSPQSCTVTVSGSSIVSASPTAMTLDAGETTTLRVTLSAGTASQTASGDYSGDVIVNCGETELKVPWFVRVDRASKP